MSLLIVQGFFAVSRGIHVPTVKTAPDNTTMKINHIVYDTYIQCQGEQKLKAKIRVFAPARAAVLPDMTVVFVIAKAFFSPGEQVFFEPYKFSPFPGDPTDDAYQDAIPDVAHPFVFVIGQVTRVDQSNPLQPVIHLTTIEYIRDQYMQSQIQCTIDKSRKRWSNTPLPRVQTIIHVFGICAGLSRLGVIQISVENLTLYLGTLLTTSASAPSTPVDFSAKKRRFNAPIDDSDELPRVGPSKLQSSTFEQAARVISDVLLSNTGNDALIDDPIDGSELTEDGSDGHGDAPNQEKSDDGPVPVDEDPVVVSSPSKPRKGKRKARAD